METIYAVLLIVISSTGDIEVSTIGEYTQDSKTVCDAAAGLAESTALVTGVTNAKAVCFPVN
jgi:hypothetical protein